LYFNFPFGGASVNEPLRIKLKQLGLTGLAQSLDVRLQEAVSHQLSHEEFLSLILEDEFLIRQERQIARRIKEAGFGELKTLDSFDFQFNPKVPRRQLYDLSAGHYIRQHRDVLLVGPPGVGKSHVGKALGYEAVKQGFRVLYRSVFDMVAELMKDNEAGGAERVLTKYLKPDLLIIDDMGLKHLRTYSGECLFEIIMRRHEVRSTMMTSNRPLEDWGKLIGDVPAATAILDRFLQQAEVIPMQGRSYRLRHKPAPTNGAGSRDSKPAKAPLGSTCRSDARRPSRRAQQAQT
jgi:DNA replication protein DnaC